MPPKPAQAIQDFVDNAIKDNKVVVFSKSTCIACNTAKEVLKKYNLSKDEYKVIEIDKRPNMGEVQNYLQRLTRARTVSKNVFLKSTFRENYEYNCFKN